VPLDAPRTRNQKDLFRWYLLHQNVEIYIDHDRQWQILFKTPCNKLLENGMCSIYETRPQICRDYSADSCSRVGRDYVELFRTPADLEQYFERRRQSGKKDRISKKQKSKKNDKKSPLKIPKQEAKKQRK
jgi:Fe-S-cluster containining protein